jgi:cell wall-associated NlpC family hydrolase
VAKVNGIALAAAGTGALFLWSGVRGAHVLVNLQDLITGKKPSDTGANPIDTGPGSSVSISGPSPTGDAIASDALKYQRHCYHYGGAPGLDGSGCWDCSSFVNWVVGHDMGMAIPGKAAGAYDGSSHGPNTLLWLAWIGTGVTRVAKAQAQAGDIFCWQTHMGIALGPDSMISAQGPDGTPSTVVATGNISNFMPGEVLFVLRLKEASVATGRQAGARRTG